MRGTFSFAMAVLGSIGIGILARTSPAAMSVLIDGGGVALAGILVSALALGTVCQTSYGNWYDLFPNALFVAFSTAVGFAAGFGALMPGFVTAGFPVMFLIGFLLGGIVANRMNKRGDGAGKAQHENQNNDAEKTGG